MLTRCKLGWVAAAGLVTSLALPVQSAGAQANQPATSADCQIQLFVANPGPGATDVPVNLVISGIAFDRTVSEGNGITAVQAFAGDRQQGGVLLGNAAFSTVSDAPVGTWSLQATFPSIGPETLFVYAQSAVSGQEASIGVPIIVGESALPTDSAPPTDVIRSCPGTIGAAAPVNPASQMSVMDVEWWWTSADDPGRYTLTLSPDGTFEAQADCTVSGGGYALEGATLALVLEPTTLSACPSGSLADEYLQGLEQVTQFSLQGENLVLTLGETGDQLVFRPGQPVGVPTASHST